MTKFEQLLQHFNQHERAIFGPVLERLTSGKSPLLAPTLSQIHRNSETLFRLIQHEPLISLGQTEFKFLQELTYRKPDLLYAFGGRGDTKKLSAIDVKKYPTYFALNSLHENSPLLFKAVTQLLIWNYANNNELIQSRVSWLIASLFKDSHPITDKLSKLIDETLNNRERADILLIASVIRTKASAIKHDYGEDDKKIAENLVYLIDQALVSHQAIHAPKLPSLFDKNLPTEQESEDTPIIFSPEQENAEQVLHEVSFEILPKDTANKSAYYQRGYAKERQLKNAQLAQFLDNAPEALTQTELEHLVTCALSDMHKGSQQAEIAFSVLFSLTTHAEPKFWWNWALTDINDERISTDYIVNLHQETWQHPISIGKRFWKPSQEEADLVRESKKVLSLPLAKEISEFLRTRSQSCTLGENLQIPESEITELCDQWLRKHIDFGRRITIAKVRNFLYWRIMQQCFDETAASFICSQPILKTPQSNTYTTIRQQKLQTIYVNALPLLSFDKPSLKSDPLIGSNLCVKEDYIKDLFGQLAAEAIEATASVKDDSDISDIAKVHNAFTTYCALFGLLITSHRPQVDPFARFADFVWELNAVAISDKIVDIGHETRVAFYATQFKSQLTRYTEHLQNLGGWLNALGLVNESRHVLDLTNSNTSKQLPLFFFLSAKNGNLSIQRVSEKTLSEQAQELKLPLNFGRHFLSSKLRVLEVPVEYINYQLGHQGPGEEPYSTSSTLSVEIVSKVLVPALDKICDQLELQVVHGLPQKNCEPPDQSPSDPLDIKGDLGPIRRIKHFHAVRKEHRSRVKSIFENYIAYQDKAFLEQNQTLLISEALDQITKQADRQLYQNLRLFSYLLKRYARRHALKIALPNKVIEIKSERSPIRYVDMPDWHRLKKNKKALRQNLGNHRFFLDQ